jgi:hypothetical protein
MFPSAHHVPISPSCLCCHCHCAYPYLRPIPVPIIIVIFAPLIHPVSSCLQWQRGVLGHPGVLVPSLRPWSPLPAPPIPCEQVLTAAVGDAVPSSLLFGVLSLFVHIQRPCPPSPVCHCPCSIVPRCWLLAPTIHPMSSGSQGWGQVLGHSLSLALLLPIPPHEQLPVVVEGVVVVSWLLSHPCHLLSHYPAHGCGWGCCCVWVYMVVVSVLPPSLVILLLSPVVPWSSLFQLAPKKVF